jgi:hypothetical protein
MVAQANVTDDVASRTAIDAVARPSNTFLGAVTSNDVTDRDVLAEDAIRSERHARVQHNAVRVITPQTGADFYFGGQFTTDE